MKCPGGSKTRDHSIRGWARKDCDVSGYPILHKYLKYQANHRENRKHDITKIPHIQWRVISSKSDHWKIIGIDWKWTTWWNVRKIYPRKIWHNTMFVFSYYLNLLFAIHTEENLWIVFQGWIFSYLFKSNLDVS